MEVVAAVVGLVAAQRVEQHLFLDSAAVAAVQVAAQSRGM